MPELIDKQKLIDRLEKEFHFKYEKCSESEYTQEQVENRMERSKGFLHAMQILKDGFDKEPNDNQK